MRIAVTGTDGQVAQALRERASAHQVEVLAVGRPLLDLTRPETVLGSLREVRPDAVINAAAYTAVDRAETEPDLADAVNRRGAGAVAEAARVLGVPVCHLSTDYVFDGALDRSYRETDPVGPVGAYGRSKLAGEEAVAATSPDHAILRTAWVYSPFGSNFIKTMLRLAATRDEVWVVADQQGTPTSALDIADGLIAVARNLAGSSDRGLRGTFHMSGSGETASWADFAEAIFAASAEAGGPSAHVRRITSAEYPTPARRPANSRLDCAKLASVHGIVLPPWPGAVRACVVRLVAGS
jgi:dTDP-4-dehydrorhamnose reductase